jgi:hypothetical protein
VVRFLEFGWKWAGLALLFSKLPTAPTILKKNHPSNQFCPLVFDTYFSKYSWCIWNSPTEDFKDNMRGRQKNKYVQHSWIYCPSNDSEMFLLLLLTKIYISKTLHCITERPKYAKIKQKMPGETLTRIAKAGDAENIQRWCTLFHN